MGGSAAGVVVVAVCGAAAESGDVSRFFPGVGERWGADRCGALVRREA